MWGARCSGQARRPHNPIQLLALAPQGQERVRFALVMADDSVQLVIERNIRRNLGTFGVPIYLMRGDPMVTRALPARRDGLSSAPSSAWWMETIDQERKAWRNQPHSTATQEASSGQPRFQQPRPQYRLAAPEPVPVDAATSGHWAYYSAGVTAHGPGGQPALVYTPCWVPAAAAPYYYA